jgi:putative spermidine/putrescine transport system substrate-binding protein
MFKLSGKKFTRITGEGAQPAQLLANKVVVIATAPNGRIRTIQQEGVPVSVIWKGGQINADVFCIPRGSKQKDLAMLFIAWTLLPENNARLLNYIPNGPTNIKSMSLISSQIRVDLPSTHISEQVVHGYK